MNPESIAKYLRILRICLFFAAASTMLMYFYSGIGVLIGLLYFIFMRDLTWRKHGIMLSWIAAWSVFVVNSIANWNAAGNPSISTTYVSMILGPISLAVYIGGFFLIQKRRKKAKPEVTTEKNYHVVDQELFKNISKPLKVLVIIGLIGVPTFFWGFMNIKPQVILDNQVRALWIHGPTTVKSGSEFNFTVQAWDQFERLSALYTGQVSFTLQSFDLSTFQSLTSPQAVLPDTYTFTGQALPSDRAYEIQDGKDNGLHIFTALITTPGIHYICVRDSTTQQTYWSNPIVVDQFLDNFDHIYWGDIHTHSQLSDGSGTAEHHYYFARYIAKLDYCALTDHAETMQFTPGALDRLEDATNTAYAPGSFVAFQGEEWTQANTGHYTCVFSGDKLQKDPALSFFALPKAQQLWETLDKFTETTGSRALAIPHHTIKQEYPQDWTYLNPKYVRFAEVTSVHGECLFEQRHPLNYRGCGDPPAEYTTGTSIMDALTMGYRLTLHGGSDEHDGHPGHSLGHTPAFIGHQYPQSLWINRADIPYPSGINAVHAINLTRDAVFTGLMKAEIYASSDYARPYLDFRINNTKVGYNATFFVGSPTATREISLIVAQDGASIPGLRPTPLIIQSPPMLWNSTVEILKNGEMLSRIQIDSPVAQIKFLDSTPITGSDYGETNGIIRDGKYYINNFSDNSVDRTTLNTRGVDFYLIRVVSSGGRTAFIGPIWVQVE